MVNTVLLSSSLLLLASTHHVSAQELPEGVTICDGTAPVGSGAAFLLLKPIPYCMNGGSCKGDYADNTEQPCICDEGYDGPHCEFEKGRLPECALHCFAGGTCTVGAKSFELVLNEFASLDDLQYCSCPEGSSGPFCEKESQQCGENYCLHGGSCVTINDPDDGSTSHYCDCTTATIGSEAFAGQYCEFKATTFCNRGRADHNGYQFCVNGGTCLAGS